MVWMSKSKKDSIVVEPSCGEGVFIESLRESGFTNITGYEVDPTLEQRGTGRVLNKSFLADNLNAEVDLIIGNPPYIRWKNLDEGLREELNNDHVWREHFTGLTDYLCIFILKSVIALKPGGELIFITPEYWLNTQGAKSLRSYLCLNGHFTDIVHFGETPIFSKVSSSIIIFRFVKNTKVRDAEKEIRVLRYKSNKLLSPSDIEGLKSGKATDNIHTFMAPRFQPDGTWALADASTLGNLASFENACVREGGEELPGLTKKFTTIGDIADIANGMVSGLDKAFQVPDSIELNAAESTSCLQVLKAKEIKPYTQGALLRYIFLPEGEVSEEQLAAVYPNFKKLLLANKDKLDMRFRYGRDIKYWEWVFPRSLHLFRAEGPKIFVPCKERISHKNYFRFCVVKGGVYPTQDVTAIIPKKTTKENIHYIAAFLNSRHVFDWLKIKGIIKGSIVEFSEKPISSIPFRKINWGLPRERQLHDNISELSEKLSMGELPNPSGKKLVDEKIAKLLDMP